MDLKDPKFSGTAITWPDGFRRIEKVLVAGKIREFETGATRDTDEGKLDFDGFLSPLVIQRYAEYMHENRKQSDGNLRDSDNWQKGIPAEAYMKSGWRHFFDWWKAHRGIKMTIDIERILCALMFNVMGYLHVHLKKMNDKHSFPSKDEICCPEGKQEGSEHAENSDVPQPESERSNESPGGLRDVREAAMPYYTPPVPKG